MQNLALKMHICFPAKKNKGRLQRGVKYFRQPAAAEVFVPAVMPLGCSGESRIQRAMLHFF